MRALAVFTTVATEADAQRLARTLVERRLVACAQISPIESVYRWDGAIQHEHEVRLLLKTTEARREALTDALRELHPYQLPAIHAVALEHVEPRYAEWVEASVAGEEGKAP